MPDATPIAAPPRRRWYQYSLRTLFVVFTAICLWLGWQVYGVRQRAEVLRWINERRTLSNGLNFGKPNEIDIQVHLWWIEIDDSKLPWYRRLLGDHWLNVIMHPIDASPDAIKRVKSAFSEAHIRAWPSISYN